MRLIAPIYAGITHSRCKFWHYPGEILLIILWMSYFLYPQLARLPAAAKTVSQQKKGQNFSRVISKFTQILMGKTYSYLDCRSYWGLS